MDQETFVRLVDTYSQTCYRMARSMLKREAYCDDALQEAITKAWAARHTLRNIQHFRTWMMRILINECHNIGRHRARIIPREDVLATAHPQEEPNDIMDLVDALPEKQRVALTLHYVEGLPIMDIAKILRRPRSTVRGLLYQARKALRLMLSTEEVYL